MEDRRDVGAEPQTTNVPVPETVALNSDASNPSAAEMGLNSISHGTKPEIPARSQEEIDSERGFNQQELESCLKVFSQSFIFQSWLTLHLCIFVIELLQVLKCFQSRLELLKTKEYKPLRAAGLVFVEGVSNRYFKGLSPQEYNHNRARKYWSPQIYLFFKVSTYNLPNRAAKKQRKRFEEEEDYKVIISIRTASY